MWTKILGYVGGIKNAITYFIGLLLVGFAMAEKYKSWKAINKLKSIEKDIYKENIKNINSNIKAIKDSTELEYKTEVKVLKQLNKQKVKAFKDVIKMEKELKNKIVNINVKGRSRSEPFEVSR